MIFQLYPGMPKYLKQGHNFRETNQFYQIFNFIGRQFAQANKVDDQNGNERSKIQRFNYFPKPTAAEVANQMLSDQGLV